MQKPKTPRDSAYLKWIRTQPCVICGRRYAIHAHHTTTGGTSLKGSDYETAPLCEQHHREVHNSGRKDNIPNLPYLIARLRDKHTKEKNHVIPA